MPLPSPARLILLAALTYIIYLHLTRAPNQRAQPSSIGHVVPESRLRVAEETFIPKKIWQTAPSSILLNALHANGTVDKKESERSERTNSWVATNPGWRYECLSDEGADEWVKEHFHISRDADATVKSKIEVRSDDDLKWVGEVYLTLKDRILKADLLRYMVLYIEGGLYTDLDTTCLHPISTWANSTLLSSASVILGIESDRQPVENDWKLYSDYRTYIWGITNWTFASRARHPFFRVVIEMVGKKLLSMAEQQNKSLGNLDVMYKDVIETTGPRAFSEGFLEYMGSLTGVKGYQQFSMLEEPKLFGGDVLVLPIRAFSLIEANRVDGEGARSLGLENLVRHWSDSTWKGGHLIDDREKAKPEGWQEIERKEGIE